MMRTPLISLLVLMMVQGLCMAADTDLPDNFPGITAQIYDANVLAEGKIFLAVASDVEGVGYYLMVLNNDGSVYQYKELPDDYAYDFKVQPNGLLSYAQFIHHHTYSGGGHCVHVLLDHDLEIVEEIQMDNDYIAEAHDLQCLPNGNILLFGYYMSQEDMSDNVAGGHPAALVSGGVVQELDSERNAVFQWRTWDAYDLSTFVPSKGKTSATLSSFHLNDIVQGVDGHLIVGSPTEIHKINRSTGEIMWILGGDNNQFTPIGEGADVSHFGGHGTYRLTNGNFLMYDNGNRKGTISSQVHEYCLDEEALTAELIWTFTPPVMIPAWHRGNAQRLANGNTFIGWGGASGKTIPTCSEVTAEGEVVLDIYFDDPNVESYRAFKLPFPGDVEAIEGADYEVANGNTYTFSDDAGDTGVTLTVTNRTGDGYNELAVKRTPFAPLNPEFPSSKAPRVLPLRWEMSQYGIDSLIANLRIDVPSLDLGDIDPDTLTIYYRPYADSGLFIPLGTLYNPTKDQIQATMFDFGEYIITYPDVDDALLPPLLNQPESLEVKDVMTPHAPLADGNEIYSVNRDEPVSLSWSPQGLASSYQLDIATDANFNEMVVQDDYLVNATYTFAGAEPNTTYYWRVASDNTAGTSDWGRGAFVTVSPQLEVVYPNGGEAFAKGVTIFIQWQDNLIEEVTLSLLKGGMVVETIDTVASCGALEWEVDLTLESGDDYAIEIQNASDANLMDTSDSLFTVE